MGRVDHIHSIVLLQSFDSKGLKKFCGHTKGVYGGRHIADKALYLCIVLLKNI